MVDQKYIEEILNQLNSGDSFKIWKALCAVGNNAFDEEIIKEFMKNRSLFIKGVDLLIEHDKPNPYVTDNIHRKKRIISIFDCYDEGKCICTLRDIFFDPSKLSKQGYVTILEELYIPQENGRQWFDGYIVKCNKCGRHYYVGQRDYHYFWYDWKEIDPITRKELDKK